MGAIFAGDEERSLVVARRDVELEIEEEIARDEKLNIFYLVKGTLLENSQMATLNVNKRRNKTGCLVHNLSTQKKTNQNIAGMPIM